MNKDYTVEVEGVLIHFKTMGNAIRYIEDLQGETLSKAKANQLIKLLHIQDEKIQ